MIVEEITELNFKEKVVVEKQYKNIKLQKEHVAEFDYKPTNTASHKFCP